LLSIDVSNTLLVANAASGKQYFPAISLKPAFFEMMGVLQVQRQRGRVEPWKHSKKVVGRGDEMPILSKLLGVNS